jgi:hypothetical protein
MDISLDQEEEEEEDDAAGDHVISSCLLGSDGELLLVRHYLMQAPKVFRVDVHRRLLEPLSSIGRSHPLFLDRHYIANTGDTEADKLAEETEVVLGEAEVDGRAAMSWTYGGRRCEAEVDGRGRPWLEGLGVPPAQHGEAVPGHGGGGDAPVQAAVVFQAAVVAVTS